MGDKAAQKTAMCDTQTPGFIALAIVQADAYIRQGYCRIEEYCDLYNHCRQKLLQYSSTQMSSSYGSQCGNISIKEIEKTARQDCP